MTSDEMYTMYALLTIFLVSFSILAVKTAKQPSKCTVFIFYILSAGVIGSFGANFKKV
jgi:hypothetical protein